MFSLTDALEVYRELPEEGREAWMDILVMVDQDAHAHLVRHLVGEVMDGKVSRIRPRDPDE